MLRKCSKICPQPPQPAAANTRLLHRFGQKDFARAPHPSGKDKKPLGLGGAGKEGNNIKLAKGTRAENRGARRTRPDLHRTQGPARRERTSASGARGRPRRGLERSRCPDERPGGRRGLSSSVSLSHTHTQSLTVCPAARDVWRREKGHHAVSKPTAESFLGAANAGGQGGSHGHVCF